MNSDAILALVGDLYAQVARLSQENTALEQRLAAASGAPAE